FFCCMYVCFFFFFQAEDGIRDRNVTGVQTCALPILDRRSGNDARLTHGARDRVVALVHGDQELPGGDPERVIELTRDIRIAHELTAEDSRTGVDTHDERGREPGTRAAPQQISKDGLPGALVRRGPRRRRCLEHDRRSFRRRWDVRGWRLEAARETHLPEARRGDLRDGG